MSVRQDIAFKIPSGWSLSTGHGDLLLSAPAPFPQAKVEIRVEKISVTAARKLRMLETVQATLAGCYPAYEVRSLLERPLAAGACVEADLRPRPGSQLLAARFYAVLLSRHLVLFDYRRPEVTSHLDRIVRRFAHGIRESRVSAKSAQGFASARRGETRLVRRSLEQWQVFLCHNSKDKDKVRELRDSLFEAGIVSWFDEKEVQPGTQFVSKIEEGLSHVDAVIVARGSHDLGDWQELEYGAALNEYVRRNRAGTRVLKIIPVALPGAPPLAEWTGFLGTFNGVEFKASLTKTGIDKLVGEIVPG